MSKRTLIKNGTIVTVDPAIGDLAKGDLLIEDGRIAQVAPQIDAGADAEVIDASDRLVLPGMVDTHRHTWQALFRNIGSDWTLAHYLSGLHGTVSGLYRAEDTYAVAIFWAGSKPSIPASRRWSIGVTISIRPNIPTPLSMRISRPADVSCSGTAAATVIGSRRATSIIRRMTSAVFARDVWQATISWSRSFWRRAAINLRPCA